MKVEIFFDYSCPYCFQGHHYLEAIIGQYSHLELDWKPCEAHPRPERVAVHSDLAIQGMYFLRDHGGDLWRYHDLIYRALFEKHQDISDLQILAGYAKVCCADCDDFVQALENHLYAQEVLDANIYAWRTCNLSAVPSYRCGSLFLGSRDGILFSRPELEKFFAHAEIRSHKDM